MDSHVKRHTLFSQILHSETRRENILALLIQDQDFPY